jgi:hypothetical protein
MTSRSFWVSRFSVTILAILVCGGTNVHAVSLIGIDFGAPTPTNWTAGTGGPNPQVFLNLIDETGAATTVDLSYSGDTFSDTTVVPYTPNAAQIPTHSNSLANIGGGLNDADGITYTFSSLVPAQPYKVWVFGAKNDFAATTFHAVTITGSGAPVAFSQTPTNTGDLWVNGQIGSNAALNSFAILASASGTGQLVIRVDDNSPNANDVPVVTLAGLAIELVPEPSTAMMTGLALLILGGTSVRHRRA